MKDVDHAPGAKVGTAVLCFFIIFQGSCAHRVTFLDGSGAKRRPRGRIGRYASTTVGTIFVDPEHLGSHGYSNGQLEKTGIVYTCKAGHIDIAHVRKTADWTAFLAANTLEQLKRNETEFSFKFKEPSRYFVQLTYPEFWQDMPEAERDRTARDVAIRLGQYFAYTGATWHEILTWFGYRSTGVYPEFPSAFSWEDSFSDLLGIHISAEAIRDVEHEYDEAVTLALNRKLEELDVQPRSTAIRASEKVRGVWFSGDFLFLVDMKARNFDIGLDDGFVTPWLVPSLAECEGARPWSYPVPSLDFLSEYGFSVKFEIEPKELQKGKILNIVHPGRKERKERIEPAVHFAAIMDYIKEDAVKRHGYEVYPGRTISQVQSEPGSQQPHKERPPGDEGGTSSSIEGIVDDLNNDNVVDFRDVLVLVDAWLAQSVPPTEKVKQR